MFIALATPEAKATLLRVALAIGLLLAAGFAVRRRLALANGGVIPDEGLSVRNVFEVIVEALTSLAKQTMGPEWRRWFPVVGTMFFFILIANLLGLIPGVGGATADVNVAAAWAIISYVLFNYVGIREHGIKNYLINTWVRASTPGTWVGETSTSARSSGYSSRSKRFWIPLAWPRSRSA